LGDGGPEEAAVSVEEGGTMASASKLNVLSTLVGGADRTSLSVESEVTAAWRREKESLVLLRIITFVIGLKSFNEKNTSCTFPHSPSQNSFLQAVSREKVH